MESQGEATITNSIVWANDGNDVNNCTATWCCIEDVYPGTGNIHVDPLFVASYDPHLLPYSPCIDAGDPSGDYTNQTDIDGQERVLYDNVDIGADEVFPIAGDIDMDGDVDFNDYAYFTGHWLKGK